MRPEGPATNAPAHPSDGCLRCHCNYFYAHAPQGFFPILNRGELAALYSFVFLFLAAAGGGAWSLDRLWRAEKD